jgi:hypothetical protein
MIETIRTSATFAVYKRFRGGVNILGLFLPDCLDTGAVCALEDGKPGTQKDDISADGARQSPPVPRRYPISRRVFHIRIGPGRFCS